MSNVAYSFDEIIERLCTSAGWITVIIAAICMIFFFVVPVHAAEGKAIIPAFAAGENEVLEKESTIKTISTKALLPSDFAKTLSDVSKKLTLMPLSKVDSAEIKSNVISVKVLSPTRTNGGVTLELFCQDNTGRFMPVWGGSIVKGDETFKFTPKDAMRENIDGCYFAVIDSNKEMVL
jgi:hypothetical protein